MNKKIFIVFIIILLSGGIFAQTETHGEKKMELLRLFPKIAMIGDSLSSGEIVEDDDRALGVLFGGVHPERGTVDEGPACVDVYEGSWLSHICRRIGAKARHYTRGGLTAKQWLEWFNYFMVLDKEKYPCYFIALGSNDFYSSWKIGTPDDTIGEETFSGYYSEIIKSIRKVNPHAIIFCLSLYHRYTERINQNGDNPQDFNRAIKDISDNYEKCYYLDFANTSENVLESSEYERRGHYDSIGYLAVSYEIEALANKALEENKDDLRDVSLYF